MYRVCTSSCAVHTAPCCSGSTNIQSRGSTHSTPEQSAASSPNAYADTVLSIPPAYEFDDLTYGMLWAASNLDDCLLADDRALTESYRKLGTYRRLSSSEVTRDVAGDLTQFARAWLGSAFCAQHILRNFGRLGDLPVFWTREQRGDEACTWLLFS